MSADWRPALLAVWLAAVAGFVDAVGYLVLHQEFVAHMTGNSSELGQGVGAGNLAAAGPLAEAVAVFVASITLTSVALELATRRRMRSPVALGLAVEAALIAALMVYGSAVIRHGAIPGTGTGFYVCATVAIAAMGVQTATVTRWGSKTIRTTYLSGMLTRLAQGAAAAIAGDPGGAPSRLRDPVGFCRGRAALLRAAVHVALWLAFVAAGALGAWTLHRYRLWSLAIPLAAVTLAAVVTAVRPRVAEQADQAPRRTPG